MRTLLIGAFIVLGLSAEVLATPSYTAIFLPSNGAERTYATAIANGVIYGYSVGGTDQALMWTSPHSASINLSPPGSDNAVIGATDGTFQVGYSNGPGQDYQAGMWQGTQSSYIDLSPPGYDLSVITGVSNGQEVGAGFQTSEGPEHALLWTGTSNSPVDLNPAGYIESVAGGTNGTYQAGSGETYINGEPSGFQALLWKGTAASVVNITPPGAGDAQAGAISGDQTVGWASLPVENVDGQYVSAQQAILWNIITGAYTDLGFGIASAISGNYEAGYVGNDAMVWAGSAGSAVNLQNFLPANYVYSEAFGVDAEGDVVGAAGSYGTWQAVVWLVPEPADFAAIMAIGSLAFSRSRCRFCG